MSKYIEITLNPITDGIIDDHAKEKDYRTDRHLRIIATDGSDRITNFKEAARILKTLRETKNENSRTDDPENGSIGTFILEDVSENMDFLIIFNDNKAFDREGNRYFVGSMLVMKIEDDYWVGLTDEEVARVKEMLGCMTYTRMNEGRPYSALMLS